MNRVDLIGRLTKDPECRYTEGGKAITAFKLAINRDGKNDKVDFIPIEAWEKVAENCTNYLRKGMRVAVEGALHIEQYEDDAGTKRQYTKIVAQRVEFLEPKKKDGQPPQAAPPATGAMVNDPPF